MEKKNLLLALIVSLLFMLILAIGLDVVNAAKLTA